MSDVDVERLRTLLERWQRGELSASEVHESAEAMWEAGDWPEYPPDDHRAIPVEVLSQLDILNQQLIVPGDVPEMISFLDTRAGEEAGAWERWRHYWEAVDYDERAAVLSGQPPYAV